jgi:hydrophobe/amphiphile efflux-3 (HAE3) family protein
MLKQIIDFQIKYSKFIFIFFLSIILISAYIGSNLEIESDFGTLIRDDSEFNVNDRILDRAFEVNDGFLFSISIDDTSILKNGVKNLDDSRVDDYIDQITLLLKESSYVISVSPPQYSDDLRLAQLFIGLQTPNEVGSFQTVLAEMNLIVDEVGEPAGVDGQITGLPILLDQIAILLVTDNLKTILITLIAIFGILYWYSRDVSFSLITMATPVVSLILLAAAMVLLDIPVTFTLAAVSVLVLGLGIDYGIHIAIHYNKARQDHESHREALYHTINDLKLPITASFLTTFAGFVALMFGISPATQAQGIVLAIGILIIYATTFAIFPLLMTMFYHKIETKPNLVFQKILEGLSKLASYQTDYAKIVLWVVGFITIIMIYGASQVQFSTSNSNWIPEDDPVSTSFREIDYQFGSSERFSMVIIANQGDLRDPQTIRDIKILEEKFLAIPQIDAINSPFSDLTYDSREIYETLTYDRKDFFNRDYTLVEVTFLTSNLGEDDSGQSTVYKEAKELLKQTPIYGADVTFYGDVVRFDELGSSLQQDSAVTTLMGFGLVFLVASILYASVYVGILALFPIIIAIIWAVGLMGFFNVPFTSLSTGIVSLVLGIGVDFSIHLVDGIRKYIAKTNNIRKSIEETLLTSGKAIILSSFTTIVGFLALTFANILATQRLGFSLAFGILSVFIVTFLVVPSTLSIIYRRKLKKEGKYISS